MKLKINNKYKLLRLISQIVFFCVFIFLVVRTEFNGNAKDIENIKLPYPVSIFLEIDPLISIGSLISSHTVYHSLIWSLIIIIGTIFIGRFFCGWICPMGSINHFLSSLKYGRMKGKTRLESNSYKPWQKWKYYILIVMLIGACFTTLQIGLMDPISLLVRSFTLVIFPSISYSVYGITNALNYTNIGVFQDFGNFLLYFFQNTLIPHKPIFYYSSFWVGIIFITILITNRFYTRFWCRVLCPLGALLGVISRFSIFGLQKDDNTCTSCNRCELYCQGADEPSPGKDWKPSECHLCLNCIDQCPEKSLKFKFFPNGEETLYGPNLQRRKVLTSIAAGAVLVPMLRSEAGLDVNYSEKLIRPPGSIEEKDFLSKCIRCGACMKVCPNNALHPTVTEAGWEGLWTPLLIPRIGYCEPTCVLCSTVCPTGAINEINQKQKGWVNKSEEDKKEPIKIGLSYIDKGRCLPWAMNTQCIVCEEWCPTSPKSIYLDEVDSFTRNGDMIHLKRPVIDPSNCVGCGACEFACPIEDRPAIHVTSIGETRSKTNRILLKNKA
jgi:polyferredoxin